MTIRDIAKAAGVSPSTVSLIINQKDAHISEETRKRVLQIANENNYVPYAGVRGRLLAQNNRVALVVPSLKEPFIAALADKVQSLARNQGYAVTVQSSFGQHENEETILSELSESYIGGLVFLPQCIQSVELLRAGESNIGGTVLLDSYYPGLPYPQISRDFAAAAEMATWHLLKNDHRQIALVLNAEIPQHVRERILSGYKTALTSVNVSYNNLLVIADNQDLDNSLGNMISTGIDAVICQTSASVSEVYRILAQKHYSVPNDISVLCLEDSPLLQQLIPATTAVNSDVDKMANLTVDFLISQLSGGRMPPITTTLPAQLIIRNSVRYHEKPKHKIVIVGSINMDVTLNVPRLPQTGETVLALGQRSWLGGKGANQAIGVSRFGADAFMIGKLGNDVYGKQLFECLSREQVNMQGVSFSQDHFSGTAFINVQSNGQNTIVVNPGANISVTPEYVEHNRSIFSDAQYCLIQMEIPLETIEATIAICKELNVKVILKPSPAQALPANMIKHLFLLIPNQEEANCLFPALTTPEEQALFALEQGVENIIITFGDKGCLYANQHESRTYSAMEFPCIDTTGASDVFISCFATQLSKGSDIDVAIKMATIAASYSVSKEGVQNSIIDAEHLLDLYNGKYSISATETEKGN